MRDSQTKSLRSREEGARGRAGLIGTEGRILTGADGRSGSTDTANNQEHHHDSRSSGS